LKIKSTRDEIKPANAKKGNIISLKRRDAVPVTEGSQNLCSSKGMLIGVVRNVSVGVDGTKSSKRSQHTADVSNLKIKRMPK